MRIRSIKPEFWRSEDISRLRVEDRLLFIGLWSYVDDNGVGRDRLSEVCADLFAHDLERDPTETFARVSRGLQQLSESGLILRYEVDGRAFFEVATWESHQRIQNPNKPRYPRYDADRDSLRKVSVDPREDIRTGTEEQGSRGTGDQSSSSEDADAPTRPEITRLLDLLDMEIERNGARKPNRTQRNTDAARLLLDRDGKTVEQVEAAIRWCQSDEFWRSNILSMSKLREKYEQLALAAKRQGARGQTNYEQGAEVHDILLARQQKAINA